MNVYNLLNAVNNVPLEVIVSAESMAGAEHKRQKGLFRGNEFSGTLKIAGVLLTAVLAFVVVRNARSVGKITKEEQPVVDSIYTQLEAMERDTTADIEEKLRYQWLADEARMRLVNFLDREGQEYRKYYGGSFLDADRMLAVYLTDSSPEVEQVFRDVLKYDERLYFLYGQYSKDELEALYRRMVEQYTEDMLDFLPEFGVDIMNNCIDVGLKDQSPESLARFWAWIGEENADMIRFIETYYNFMLTTYVFPGVGVSGSWGGSNIQSVGYRGYRLNNNGQTVSGFTSCGHNVPQNLYIGYTKVGVKYDYAFSGSADISFYDATSAASLTNITAYTNESGGYITISSDEIPSNYDPTGDAFVKYGMTSEMTEGDVYSGSWVRGGVSDLLKTSALALPGDSGGVGLVYYNYQYRIVGSVSGGDYNSNTPSASSFVASFFSRYHNNKAAITNITHY